MKKATNPEQCSRLYPLSILSRKWSYLLLRALQEPKTFSEAQKELRFVTNHILAREFKQLEREGLIQKEERYHLTRTGKALLDSAEPLMQWSHTCANLTQCPREKKCSSCAMYPEVLGVRTTFQMRKR